MCLGKTNYDICPVNSLLAYHVSRLGTPVPLFVIEDGRYLTRKLFRAQLNTIFQEAGLNAKDYNTHSFRKGAATSAREAGISYSSVQMLGRWKSDACEVYIHIPREELAKFSSQLRSLSPL